MSVAKWFMVWFVCSAGAATYLSLNMFKEEEKTAFLPDTTSHGHYQIEMKCAECHTPMMGVKQDACVRCHAEDLKLGHDSHPETKFNDPRNFEMIAKIDARKCITCHTEHRPDKTDDAGVTLPMDYCSSCHQDIGEERPSHKGLKFDSCATSGCHNYHDNKALYEEFLLKHYGEDDIKKEGIELSLKKRKNKKVSFPAIASKFSPLIAHDWEATAHAKAGVDCADCHQPEGKEWSDKVPHQTCQECHEYETKGFLEGRHGMRLAAGLSPMKPEMARLPMKKSAAHSELNCISCHSSHRFDIKEAAVDSCLKCHDDQHSLNYLDSPHFKLFEKDKRDGTNTGVSCATCHMPRIKVDGEVKVEHNQNAFLRPNEKMVRSSCIKCHGLQFTLNSLADEDLIKKNFNGKPNVHIESLEWAKERDKD